MKAIGFFFAIFLSMLAVFLVATGEVKRWFSEPARSPIHLGELAGNEDRRPDGQNLLEFDFYDVDEGRRNFSVRAYLTQEDSHVDETKIAQIRELTLHDGTLEVPLEDATPPAAENTVEAAPSKDEGRKVVLHFQSALFTRGDPATDEKKDFVVLLREGRGVTDDGTEFFFDDLRFAKEPRSPGEEKQGTGFLLTSNKHVAIRGKAVELTSPTGFDGILGKTAGIDTFHFHPPVTALIDPREHSPLQLDAAAVPVPGNPPEPSAKAGQGDARGKGKIAVTCQGPLSLTVGKRGHEAAESRPANTFIRFQKDVKLFVVDPATAVDSLPAADGSRMECQYLEFELERWHEELVPRRALATGSSPDAVASNAAAPAGPVEGASPVKIYIHKDGGNPYVIQGDRLEWLLRESAPGAPAGERLSEAILSPRPVLRGDGVEFTAERAALRLPENRLILETVQGTIRHEGGIEKPRKGKEDRSSPLFRIEPPPVAGAEKAEGGAEKAAEKTRSSLPAVWDVKADEAEFFFVGDSGATEAAAGLPRGLSRLIARSREPGGVQIKSRPEGQGGGAAPQNADSPFVSTCDVLTYVEGEKKATLEGSPARKPRFERGTNWIEARRMDIHLEEAVAVFEEEVVARLEDLKSGRGAARGGEETGEAGAGGKPGEKSEAASPVAKASIKAIDVESKFLAIRFKDRKDLLDLIARGSADEPVRATAYSVDDHWYRLLGPQLHWDQEAEVAQLLRMAGDAGTVPAVGDASASMPRLEYEGGDARAESIRFERATWKAILTDGVIVRTFPSDRTKGEAASASRGSPEVEIAAGSADVEFFPKFERRGLSTGSLERLSSIKSLRARRAPGSLIQIKTPDLTGRTEELSYDSETRQLRFQGNGLQEIEVAREDFQGPITAKEITFDEEKRLLILSGGVQGRLVQARIDAAASPAEALSRSSVEPAALGGRGEQSLAWQFTTNVLEVQLKDGPGGRGFELVSARARDKVHLRNEERGIQLLGDDLTYEEATRKVHVFSPDGRPQTLLCDRSTAGRAPNREAPSRGADTAPEEVHKIVAQEIWAILQENPHALAAKGEPREWLIVSFHRDVIGSFHLPPPDRKEDAVGLGDLVKMVAERLTLYIDPAQPRDPADTGGSSRMIPWAIAAGNVDFSSGALRATADRAILEEPFGRLTLFGSPARLSLENKQVFEDPEIAIRRIAGDKRFQVEYLGAPRPRTTPLPAR